MVTTRCGPQPEEYSTSRRSEAAALIPSVPKEGIPMKRAWKWIRRSAIGMGVLMLVSAAVAGANWKRLLIAWHWEGMKECLGAIENQWDHWPDGFVAPPSNLAAKCSRLFGFPPPEYFAGLETDGEGSWGNTLARARYHGDELHRLGYIERRIFPFAGRMNIDQLLNLQDCPFFNNPPSWQELSNANGRGARLTHVYEDGREIRGGCIYGTAVVPEGTRLVLLVQDLPSRMSLWESFALRHNSDDLTTNQEGSTGK
jgi:hypothetical protein